jgi:hypothetical protein
MRLFDDIERRNASPPAYGEDTFTFLNRADGAVWARIRDVLDAWFAEYPEPDAADLRGRYRSQKPGQHVGAWWELYLHHLFTRLGYAVAVHPEVPGTLKQPDFEVRRGDLRFYLEAAVVFSGIVDDRPSGGGRDAWILDAVNKGSNANFTLGIEFLRRGTRKPRDRDVYRPLEVWLADLDPDEVLDATEAGDQHPKKLLTVQDWELRFTAYPVKPEAREDEDPGPLLGVGPVVAGFVDDKAQLRATLKHKRRRYGQPDAPLIVAVNCASSFTKPDDVAAALYGSLAMQYTQDVPGTARWVRVRDGTWMSETGPQGRSMSAVLTAVHLHPWTVVKEAPRLWLNPWARTALDADLPFSTGRCSDAGDVSIEERSVDMAKLLCLPAEWPGPEPPFA